jgi:hypothetical protein
LLPYLYNPFSDPLGDLGHDGVPETSQSVYPIGNPISHSTHVGFSEPLASWFSITSFNGREFRFCVAVDERPPFQSREEAVGNFASWCVGRRLSLPAYRACSMSAAVAIDDVGDGNFFTSR